MSRAVEVWRVAYDSFPEHIGRIGDSYGYSEEELVAYACGASGMLYLWHSLLPEADRQACLEHLLDHARSALADTARPASVQKRDLESVRELLSTDDGFAKTIRNLAVQSVTEYLEESKS